MSFCHLHIHSEFSLLDGLSKVEHYVNRCAELGFPAFALTDHGYACGWIRAWTACEKHNIKFIPGVELYLSPPDLDTEEKKISFDHLTVLAKNLTGYHNLLTIISESGKNLYRNKPISSYSLLEKYVEGLIVLSGCTSSRLLRLISTEDDPTEWIQYLHSLFKDDLYLEVQPNNIDLQKKANKILPDLSLSHSIPLVITNDVHYLSPEDARAHEVMLCVQSHDSMLNTVDRWRFTWDGFYYCTPSTLKDFFHQNHPDFPHSLIDTGISSTIEIANKVNLPWPIPDHYIFPHLEKIAEHYPTNLHLEFRTQIWKGIAYRELHHDSVKFEKEYLPRLEREMDVIEKQGFIPYFLIVSDLMRWCKKHNILVGPGRGSSGGSLVCYLLDITEIDPLKYDTLFERFITDQRADLPDVDMDFPSSRREEVIHYLQSKYGEENVSAVATFTEFKGRLALRDVARVYGIEPYEIGKVAPLIVHRSGGDERADYTLEDTIEESPEMKEFAEKYPHVIDTAQKLEGVTRHLGKHAAGIVITDDPCTTYFPTFFDGESSVSHWNKDDLEKMKLMKMDILGVNVLDTLTRTKELVKLRQGIDITFYNLAATAADVFQMFNEGNTVGVFQFESKGIQSWCRRLNIKNFHDIVVINSLFRPGTIGSGLIQKYVNRKNGIELIDYPHPLYEPILKNTYGIPIFQEQIMLIMHKIGGFPWKTSDTIRKIIGKSQGVEQFNKYKEPFLIGCEKMGVDKITSEKMFDTVRTFGMYGFNLAHAVEYSLIGYWTAFMKLNYPLEYLSTLISIEHGQDQTAAYLKEAKRLGIEILPPNVDKSQWDYTIEGNAIRCGLKHIKGVGEIGGKELIAQAPFGSWRNLISKVNRRAVNVRVLRSLAECGATSHFTENLSLKSLRDTRTYLRVKRSGSVEETTPWYGLCQLLGGIDSEEKWDILIKDLQSTPEYTEQELTTIRAEVFPMPIGQHPLSFFKKYLGHFKLKDVKTVDDLEWKEGWEKVAGMVTNVGTAHVHRIDEEGKGQTTKLMYFSLDGEHDYLNCMLSKSRKKTSDNLQIKVRELNGKVVVADLRIDIVRNKAYCFELTNIEELIK